MELIRFNRQYHLTIKPSTLVWALALQAIIVGQLAILSCKWALKEAAIANVENRVIMQDIGEKADALQEEIRRTYGIIQVER